MDREKAEAQGKQVVEAAEGEQDPSKMTETEIYSKKIDDKAKGETGLQKSEEQIKREKEDKESS